MSKPLTTLASCGPPDEARIELLLRRYGGAVPATLLDGFIRRGIERTRERYVSLPWMDIECEWWLTLNGDAHDILRKGDNLHPDRLAPSLMPFAVGAGSVLCICTDTRDSGAVYRWLPDGEGSDVGDEAVERICGDFDAFVQMLSDAPPASP